LADVGVADEQLGLGTERALRIVVDDLAEVLARTDPPALLQLFLSAIEEELVSVDPRRHDLTVGAATGPEGRRDEHRHDRRGEPSAHVRVAPIQRYMSRRPVSRSTVGVNPRSRLAREVSA